MISMTGAVTGAIVTGLTSPTFTLTADGAADAFSAQSAVTTLGGTQTGAAVHSVSQPFTVTIRRPRNLKVLGKANLNGYISNVGRNTYTMLFRKGVTPLAGQPFSIAIARFETEIPSGAEVADVANLKSWISFMGGFISSNATGLFQTWTDGILKA